MIPNKLLARVELMPDAVTDEIENETLLPSSVKLVQTSKINRRRSSLYVTSTRYGMVEVNG